jgi:hypothetical protein
MGRLAGHPSEWSQEDGIDPVPQKLVVGSKRAHRLAHQDFVIRVVPLARLPQDTAWEREHLARTGALAPGTMYLLTGAAVRNGLVAGWKP